MPASQPRTDEDLRRLLKSATPQDIDALTDDEVARLHKISGLAQYASDPLSGKPTLAQSERAKVIAETPVLRTPDPGTKAGPEIPKDSPKDLKELLLAIGEAAGSGGDRPTPEGRVKPEDMMLGSLNLGGGNLRVLGGVLSNAGAEVNDLLSAISPSTDQGAYQNTYLTNPDIERDKRLTAQNRLIGENQPMGAFSGPQPSEGPSPETMIKIAGAVLPELAASAAEFVSNPVMQLATRPLEFGGNALQASLFLRSAKAAGAVAESAGAVAEARSVLATADVAELAAAGESLESKLDDISHLKDLNRELGGDPKISEQLRASEAGLTEAKVNLDEFHAYHSPNPEYPDLQYGRAVDYGKGKSGNIVDFDGDHAVVEAWDGARTRVPLRDLSVPPERDWSTEELKAFGDAFRSQPHVTVSPEDLAKIKANPAVPGHIEFANVGRTEQLGDVAADAVAKMPLPEALVSEATEPAKATIKLTDVLSASPAGALLLAGASQDDEKDPTPRQGHPLAMKSALWAVPAGIFAYGVARYFTNPEFRTAVKVFTSIDKSKAPDLERVFETFLAPLFPDTPANGMKEIAPALGTAAGAAAGGFVASQYGRDDVNPALGVAGILAGAALGAAGGVNLAKQFKTGLTYRQLYKTYFTEAAGMSESAVNMKRITRQALEGRAREIKDVSTELNSFNQQTNGLVQAFMSGNANIEAVPKAAQPAAQMARQLFDNLSMDLLSSGLIKNGILRDTITRNMGTYVPRLLLRYELEERAPEVVANWLKTQGKGWGHISSGNYLKQKKDLPPAVLKALGEITDNPGYLLAKRGVTVAADIEQARYHRFLLASPENSIPSKLVRTQTRIGKLQTSLREGADEFASPRLIREAKGQLLTEPQEVKFFKADGGMEAAEWQGRTYWKMPDDPRYGLVRNRFLEQSVASDIRGTFETSNGLSGLYEGSLSTFKFFKAVFNPASQFRNMAANAILADVVGGVPVWRMDKWGRAAHQLKSGGKWYKAAIKDGTFGGEFTVAEIQGLLDPHFKGASSVMDFIGKAIPGMAHKPADFFMKWHQTSEAHARLTVYMHAIESLGMKGLEAAAFARRVIPDYQDVPRWIKIVRKSPFGSPFVSFSYKAIPRTMEAAFAFGDPKKMWRFWKYPFAMAALNEYGAQKFGMLGKDEKDQTDVFGTMRRMAIRTLSGGNYSPDSYDTFRKYLPNHVGKMQITIPRRDQYDRPQYLDGTYFLPWGDAGEMGKGDIGRNFGVPWLPRQLEPSNPWLQTAVAAMTGKDSFTGNEITPSGAVGIEHIAALGQFLMRAWAPSLTPGAGYGAESLRRSFSSGIASDPNTKSRTAAVGSDIFGARSRPVDPATAYKFKLFERNDLLDQNKSEIRRLARRLDIETDDPNAPVDRAAMAAYMAKHPSSALSRALARRQAILDKFNEDYPAGEVPPSPDKLIDAIQRAQRR